MNVNLLNNAALEKIVTEAGFDSLESLAIYATANELTNLNGIGEKRAEEIKESLRQLGLRTELNNEEYFLVEALERDGNRAELIERFWMHPMTEEQKERLDSVLARLTDRERDVLKLHYGIGCERATLEEIGQEFGVTRERVRQIVAKASRKLRGSQNRDGILELVTMPSWELQKTLLETRKQLSIANETLSQYEQKFGKLVPDAPIEVLELSFRTHRSLERAGIKTIEQVKTTDLTKVRNLGRKGMEEVTEKIAAFIAS